MAQQFDGELTINTKLEKKDFEEALGDITNSAAKAFNEIGKSVEDFADCPAKCRLRHLFRYTMRACRQRS